MKKQPVVKINSDMTLIKSLFFTFLLLVPLVFCLCTDRNYETYKLIIQVVKIAIGNLKEDFNPKYWMSDYEPAIRKAVKEEVIFLKEFHLNNELSVN